MGVSVSVHPTDHEDIEIFEVAIPFDNSQNLINKAKEAENQPYEL